MRLIFDHSLNPWDVGDLYSLTFVGLVSILIGFVPLVFASDGELQTWSQRIWRPVASVVLFFALCYATRLEDLICIVIMAAPFYVVAAIGVIIATIMISRYRASKGVLLPLMFFPLACGLSELHVQSPMETYTLRSTVTIEDPSWVVWRNIVRVSRILPSEYERGLFNYAGIPVPVSVELDRDTLHATRTGQFDNGLQLTEHVTEWERDRHVAFDIKVDRALYDRTAFNVHELNGGALLVCGGSVRHSPSTERQRRSFT